MLSHCCCTYVSHDRQRRLLIAVCSRRRDGVGGFNRRYFEHKRAQLNEKIRKGNLKNLNGDDAASNSDENAERENMLDEKERKELDDYLQKAFKAVKEVQQPAVTPASNGEEERFGNAKRLQEIIEWFYQKRWSWYLFNARGEVRR